MDNGIMTDLEDLLASSSLAEVLREAATRFELLASLEEAVCVGGVCAATVTPVS